MKIKKIVVATGNAHKLQEISAIFEGVEVLSQKQCGFDEDVAETGATFAENALIKARAAAKALGIPVIADDSGLCVKALDGAPGVRSARYAGGHGDDKANRALLLKNMQGVEDRTAWFESCVAFVFPKGKEIVVSGKTYGKILHEEVGEKGFGYDSLFYSDDLQMSFAQADMSQKNAVSHRGRALAALKVALEGEDL
ncbi:MAG: RdgB/HAM1 family non-canonical purine NTP pyrophosphatase [Clostridia bacterium]|nr:RdgB/HAM1 family non-canonical purine NTP pyrophosphatase [Clostridia bacterium]